MLDLILLLRGAPLAAALTATACGLVLFFVRLYAARQNIYRLQKLGVVSLSPSYRHRLCQHEAAPESALTIIRQFHLFIPF